VIGSCPLTRHSKTVQQEQASRNHELHDAKAADILAAFVSVFLVIILTLSEAEGE